MAYGEGATVTLAFFVPGLARPKGSKRGLPIYRGKKGQPREFTGHVALVESAGRSLKAWEQDIRAAAATAMEGHALLDGPITCDLLFVRPRPKADKKCRLLAPITRPDRLKLARAVEDALTGIVWRDDAQVVGGLVSKVFGDPPGVKIALMTLDGVEP